jgi:hypothetical protein
MVDDCECFDDSVEATTPAAPDPSDEVDLTKSSLPPESARDGRLMVAFNCCLNVEGGEQRIKFDHWTRSANVPLGTRPVSGRKPSRAKARTRLMRTRQYPRLRKAHLKEAGEAS